MELNSNNTISSDIINSDDNKMDNNNNNILPDISTTENTNFTKINSNSIVELGEETINKTHSNSNNTNNNNNNNNNTTHSHSPSHYIMIQYHIIEKYLKNFLNAGVDKWSSKIQQIKDIIRELYSNPIDLNFSDLDIGIDEESLYSNSSSDKFLNTYSMQELEDYFEKFGIKGGLAARGYTNPKITIDYSDPFVHRLEVIDNIHTNNGSTNGSSDPKIMNQILIDIFIRRKEINVNEILEEKKRHDNPESDKNIGPPPNVDPRYVPQFKMEGQLFEWKDLIPTEQVIKQIDFTIHASVIEWMCLQDPSRVFVEERPPLPGQLYPGLGVTKQINNLLVHLATSQRRDCLLNKPFRFYNAFMYQTRDYFYIDPSVQAIFLSLLNDVEGSITKFGLSLVSWCFEFGCVRERATGNIVKWEFHKQARPISNRMCNYFKSKQYTELVQKNMRPHNTFYIDFNGHPSLSHFNGHPLILTEQQLKDQSPSTSTETTTTV